MAIFCLQVALIKIKIKEHKFREECDVFELDQFVCLMPKCVVSPRGAGRRLCGRTPRLPAPPTVKELKGSKGLASLLWHKIKLKDWWEENR